MVSAQIPGQYKIYLVSPKGDSRLVQAAAAGWWGPGGSSDGVIANTPEKWNKLAPSIHAGAGGYSILVTATTGSATTDASDGNWVIPIMVDGQPQTIGNPAAAGGMGNDNFIADVTPGDIALVASQENVIAKLRAKDGIRQIRIGAPGDAGRVFLSIENNA